MARSRPPGSALAALTEAEKAAVLDDLLASRPELHDAAEELAASRLAAADRDAVAGNVAWSLQLVEADAVFARSGPQRGRGYVHPNEAAWELLEEELEPYLEDVRRLVALGMEAAARETGIGILVGLYECRDFEDEDSALAQVPAADFAFEEAAGVLIELQKVGVEGSVDVLEELLPEWAEHLRRTRGQTS